MTSSNRGEWSEKDIETLKEVFPTRGAAYCAELFGRSKSAILKKTAALGIKHGRVSFQFLKENFEPLIKRSKNITDAVCNLGSTAAGGNHATVKKYIKKYGIDTSHFALWDEERIQNMYKKDAVPLEDVLVENSTYSRTHLKARLYKEGFKKRECELCGQGEEWHGRHMSLILDHKNGVNNDNRLENLRIVCPNCNATLDTHGGRNNKKEQRKYTCPDCDGPMGATSTWCNVCAKKHYKASKRKFDRPPYEVLVADVNKLNYNGTAKKYGTSNTTIHKWIKHYETSSY